MKRMIQWNWWSRDSNHGGEDYEKTDFLEEPYYGGDPVISDYVEDDYYYLDSDNAKLPQRKPQPRQYLSDKFHNAQRKWVTGHGFGLPRPSDSQRRSRSERPL